VARSVDAGGGDRKQLGAPWVVPYPNTASSCDSSQGLDTFLKISIHERRFY
jgi:hypothetical protein